MRRPTLSATEVARQRDAFEAKAKAERVAKLMRECGVPPTLHDAVKVTDATLPPDARPLWAAARSLIEHHARGKSIVGLIGRQGTGKTTLAASLVLRDCQAERPARYVAAWDYVDRLATARRFSSTTTGAKVEELFCRAPLLVIDELQLQEDTQFNTLAVRRLVLRRWDLGLATLVLGNDTRESFDARVGREIVSRINESGDVFNFEYTDLRVRSRRD